MAKLQLTLNARVDLADIDEWGFQQFGRDTADIYFRGFKAAFDRLEKFPLAGAPQLALGRNIRCLTHRKHRIFYIAENDIVLIIRVIHHARNARQVLKK